MKTASAPPTLIEDWERYRHLYVPALDGLPCPEEFLELLKQTWMNGARKGTQNAIRQSAKLSPDLYELRALLSWALDAE